MTNPQVEDGYTRIANELYDAMLSYPFSKRELLVVLAIMRKTYGFNKKADDITNSQLCALTGLTQSAVSKTINDLHNKGVLQVSYGRYGKLLQLNKHYKLWRVVKTTTVANSTNVAKTTNSSCQNDKSELSKRQTQKTTPKDNTQKTGRFTPPSLQEVREYCLQRGNGIDPQRFIDFYEANGWVQGKGKPVKNWQACIRTWEARNPKPKEKTFGDGEYF